MTKNKSDKSSYLKPGEKLSEGTGFVTTKEKFYPRKYPNKPPKLPKYNPQTGKPYKEGDIIVIHREYKDSSHDTTNVDYKSNKCSKINKANNMAYPVKYYYFRVDSQKI